jgi:prenyltransferase beta subunit
MIEVNKYILKTLEKSTSKLSNQAIKRIKEFLMLQLHHDGGFMDRAGNPDPYYSVFGYMLAFILDLEIPVNKQLIFVERWSDKHEIDFIHAVSLVQCKILISAIQLKSKGVTRQFFQSKFISERVRKNIVKDVVQKSDDLLRIIESYRSQNNGYNQSCKNADYASTYATFLAWSLFQDLGLFVDEAELLKSIQDLQKENGSFVNERNSSSGVTTATAAGLIMSKSLQVVNIENSISWLKERWIIQGGFVAAEGLPIADLLSTSTALLALKMADYSLVNYSEACTNFINMHWDNSGGFFGSVADMHPDCEYTYYALLALGLI